MKEYFKEQIESTTDIPKILQYMVRRGKNISIERFEYTKGKIKLPGLKHSGISHIDRTMPMFIEE